MSATAPVLQISPELGLPLDAVTETFAILAKRRAGKSNAAVVMAEEMYDHGLPWVAIDPKGDWWGVRAAGDGKSPGLAVLVFGGLHGDVPLEPTSGRLVADLIIEQRLTSVLDVSEMSKADQRRFLVDFADRLYRRNTEPLHVFCEEADEYIPQRVSGADAKLVGVFETLVKRGGFRGIGCTLITQRSASLNKDVLTQIETLIPMRTPSPQDRKAIEAWVDYHEAGKEAVGELPGLADGEAWVFSPQWLRMLTKIKFRRRRTFDSGATPKVGGKPRPPATLAEVDLAAIKEAMAETIEKQKADDPKYLRQRIAQLERELKAERDRPSPVPTVEHVEVPVLDPAIAGELLQALEPFEQKLAYIDGALSMLSASKSTFGPGRSARDPSAAVSVRGQEAKPRSRRPEASAPISTPRSVRSDVHQSVDLGDVTLGKTEKAILSVLAQHGPRTHSQLALLSGYSPKASTIGVAASKLRKIGFIQPNQPYEATPEGLEWIADKVEPLPEGQALLDYWRNRFGKTELVMLDALVDLWPNATTQHELADITGYSPTASTIGVALSKLRKVGVVDGWCLADDFAESVGLA